MNNADRPPTRTVARLDIKGKNLIKGIQLEGLRVLGDPNEFATRYYSEGIEEILYIDTVASLYGRSYMTEILERTVQDVFVPITVGGGVSSVEDVRQLLRSGADKIAINSAGVKNPQLISDIAQSFGNQCTVASIQAKRLGPSRWEVLIEGGRERTGLDVIEWAEKVVGLGAGEVLLTSVDMDGTKKGFDLDLVRQVREAVDVPLIASGGLGQSSHAESLLQEVSGIDAIAAGTALHYKGVTVAELKRSVRGEKG